ncbi:MAG: tetratricopeptide repeat protein [Myxococcales bacterium]|nr:tetratricopeptide repeat protein [Myxococcales bacterium]USN50214.1 MAG: tetratricopeptide repeat protein [Myxococcales bacterium]
MKKITFLSLIGMIALCEMACVSSKPQVKPDNLTEISEGKRAQAFLYFKEGAEELERGQNKNAENKFAKAVQIDPGFYEAYYNRGVAFEALGDLRQAEENYLACLKINKTQPACLENAIVSKIKQNDQESAQALVKNYLDEFPKEAFAHSAAALLAFLERDFTSAEKQARLVLEYQAENIEALFIMARIFFERKEYAAARWVLKNAIELAPSYGELYLWQGHTYARLEQTHDALESYRLAVKFRPTQESLESYGLLLLKRGRVQESIAELERLVELFSSEYRNFMHLANAYAAAKQFEKAKSAYDKARELNPNDEDINLNLGLLFYDLKHDGLNELERLEQSQSYFKKYLEGANISKERRKEVEGYLKDLEQKIETQKDSIQAEAEQSEQGTSDEVEEQNSKEPVKETDSENDKLEEKTP